MIDEAREILAGWGAPEDLAGAERMLGAPWIGDGPVIGLTPAGWLIVGRDRLGRTHAGCRADLLGLARDLARIADGEATPAAPPPPSAAPMFVADDESVPVPTSPTQDAEPEQGASDADQPAGPHGSDAAAAPDPFEPGISAHTHHRKAYAGTMTLVDEVELARGQVIRRATDIESDLVFALTGSSEWADLAAAFQEYQHLGALGRPVSDELRERHLRFQEFTDHRQKIRDHGVHLRDVARLADMDKLRAMSETMDDGWPRRK
jgi:hypothetical protein